MRARNAAVISRLLLPVILGIGQSWSTWARAAVSSLPDGTPTNDKYAYIWRSSGGLGDTAQVPTGNGQLVPLVYGPLSGGGNEQQPGNFFLDTSFQSGSGWLPGCFRELRVNYPDRRYGVFQDSIGGSFYSSSGAFGADGDWTPDVASSAYQDMLANYRRFRAAVNAMGYEPDPQFLYTDLGISDGSSNLTQANNFETNHSSTYLTRMLADGIIRADTPIYQARYSDKLVGTYKSTIRTAEVNIATANPTRYFLFNADGYQPISGVEDHPTCAWYDNIGRRMALRKLGIVHPLDNIVEMGATEYAVRDWELASLEAGLAVSNTVISSAYELSQSVVNTYNMTNGTAGQQPGLVKATLTNGWDARFASFNGTSHVLRNASPVAINQSGGFLLIAAVKATAANNTVLYSEGNDSSATPFWGIKSDTSGNLCITLRDDANAVPLSLSSFGTVAFDNTMHMVAVSYDPTAGQFKAWVDGTQCPNTLTYTKTAITLNNSSIGAQYVGSGSTAGGFMTIARLGRLSIFKVATANVAAFVASLKPFYQRAYGTA